MSENQLPTESNKWDSWRKELEDSAQEGNEWIDEEEMPKLLAEASRKGISVQTMLACRKAFQEDSHFHSAVRRAAIQGKARALVVDPDEQHLRKCVKLLNGTGLYEAFGVAGAAEALRQVETFVPHILITEMALPGAVNGLGLRHHLESKLQKQLPVLLMEKVLDSTPLDAVSAKGLLHIRKTGDFNTILHCSEALLRQ
jgi:CheY-like chemotaxis protein